MDDIEYLPIEKNDEFTSEQLEEALQNKIKKALGNDAEKALKKLFKF